MVDDEETDILLGHQLQHLVSLLESLEDARQFKVDGFDRLPSSQREPLPPEAEDQLQQPDCEYSSLVVSEKNSNN